MIQTTNSKERVLSGMRPTGPLHIGHYVGVIKNWVELQKTYECFLFLADWHALTSNFDEIEIITKSRIEYIRGWLASGVDPDKVNIYCQSEVPEVLMLSQFFLCLTPPGWADRSPSWKDFQNNPNANKKLDNLGFYTYPILQAADIAIVRGNWVPVGEDQIAHIEIAREIVRKFNRLYKTHLPEPAPKLSATPKLPGIDGGKKMSSSLGNVISLNEDEKSLQKKISKIKSDDKRLGVESPGDPDNCNVFAYHKVFSSAGDCSEIDKLCRSAKLSCGECKAKLSKSMKEELLPISEKSRQISDKDCLEVLHEGNLKVGKIVKDEWNNLKEKIGF